MKCNVKYLLAALSATVFFGLTTAQAFTGPGGMVAPTGTNPATGVPWAPGDTYHLIFLTSTSTIASSGDIDFYNTFVNTAAAASPLTGVPDVTWYALGSTADGTSARNNAVVSAPVYLLDGISLVATNSTDMWDGSIGHVINLLEDGVTTADTIIWSGSSATGYKDTYRYLGYSKARYGWSTQTSSAWFNSGSAYKYTSNLYPLYALSELLTIAGAAPEEPISPQPANNAVNVAGSTELSWESLGATDFEISLWPDGGATNTASGAGMSWDPPGYLTPGTAYSWQVIVSSIGGSATGPVWTFTTRAAIAPDAFASLAPANEAVDVVADTPLSWETAGGASGYEVYLWPEPDSEPVAPSATTTAISWDPPGDLTPDTAYSWKVVATNQYGSTTGTVWTFTTVPVIPGTSSALSPTNGATAMPASISLSWTTAVRAAGYEVYFWSDSEIEPASPSATTLSTVWSPGGLQHTTTYHWKVVATNDYGTAAADQWTFTTAGPLVAPGALLAPTGVNPGTGLPWAPGDKYHLAFVTRGTTQATSSDIADYDQFVNTEAQLPGSAVAGYAVTWFVIGSTLSANAADHALISAPVYRLDGELVATNKTDMWDGSLVAAINHDQYVDAWAPNVWTGSTSAGIVNSSRYFGASSVRFGSAGSTDYHWMDLLNMSVNTGYRPVYALSEPLMIPLPTGTLLILK